jgi:hypothetical protein
MHYEMGIACITNCFSFLLRKVTKERESFVMTNILGYAFLTQCVLKEQMQLSHRLFEG